MNSLNAALYEAPPALAYADSMMAQGDSYSIAISHHSEHEFLEDFRRDLSGSSDHVIILSPFLSRNRAIHYYPVFHALTLRNVKVDVYVRPKYEQPESLRDHFEPVTRRLENIGVKVHLRPGMHEKVGIIDGKILWHGSLNPFSHNDTRESMLRFESEELTRDIVASLELDSHRTNYARGGIEQRHSDDYESEVLPEEAPACPACGHAMRPYEEAGMWICSRSPACEGTLPLAVSPPGEEHRLPEAQVPSRVGITCPLCNAPMDVHRGVRTRIVCSSATCDFALDPRLSAGIFRILSRKRQS